MDMAWFCKCALCVWHIVLYLLTSLILCLYDFMWMQLFDLGLVAFFIFLLFVFLYFSVLTVFFLLFYGGQFNWFCGLSGNREINGMMMTGNRSEVAVSEEYV